jgi:uncharacterized membrane protein
MKVIGAWTWRYRARLYLRNTLWIPPVLGMVLGLVAARVVGRAGAVVGHESTLDPDAARTVLVTLASSMFTFIVFVSSTLLLALQLASAQLTPRAIALIFRDPVAKCSSTLFTFTFTFVIAIVVRISGPMALLEARLAAYSCMISLGAFFYLIDHIGKALRPSEVLRRVAIQGCQVIDAVYPHRLVGAATATTEPRQSGSRTPTRTIRTHVDGMLLACDVPGIVLLAEQANCVLELVPQVGDFLAAGDPLFHVYGGGSPPADALRRMVAIGHERTMEQDPAFAFRIIVDIACKALSPAINDPTTAVLAIDRIHHLLREVGQRRLDDDRIRDGMNQLRLMYRTPDWEDFVHLAVTEIRQFGRESIQVMRRLRAMLENLIETLPEERGSLLRDELGLLHRSATRFFPAPEDQALADTSDSQGVGGRTHNGSCPEAAPSPSNNGEGRGV